MKTALLIRLGGAGDIIILGGVAKELKKRGYTVDACLGSPSGDPSKWFMGTDIFNKIIQQGRSHNGVDIYKEEDGNWYSVEFLKQRYDLVADYKFSVEMNSHFKHMANGPGKEWFASQNSNYVNWNDIMLAWAGIDPTTVSNDDKAPVFTVLPDETAWAKRVLGRTKAKRLISIQTNASSLVRTFYHPDKLPTAIRDEFPDTDFILFDGAQWINIKGKHSFPILIPKELDPIRASAALVAESDLFIGADSGFSHIAEALKVKSLTIYTTVPAWTRMGYYKYAKAIEPIGKVFDGVECRPCFVLDRYCPRIRERASKELTEREQKIKTAIEQNRHPAEVAKELSTTPQGIAMEAEMMQRRYQALLEMAAPCAQTITPERIVQAVKEIL